MSHIFLLIFIKNIKYSDAYRYRLPIYCVFGFHFLTIYPGLLLPLGRVYFFFFRFSWQEIFSQCLQFFKLPCIMVLGIKNKRQCWNWQTGTFEGRVSLTYGFKSHLPHQAEPGRTSRLRFFFISLIQTLHQPTKSHDIQDDIPILDNKLHFNKDFFSKNN